MTIFLLLQPALEGRNCIADEHYLPTFFHVRISVNVVSLAVLFLAFLTESFDCVFRWSILLELLTGQLHMLIGLRESGTQNHTRLRILRKSFWRILRYDSAWSIRYFARNSNACEHVCILLRHVSQRIILMVLFLGEFSSSPLQSFHATNNCVSWLGKKVIYYPSFAAMSIWTHHFRNCSNLNEIWILIDTLMMLYLQSIDVSVHVTSDEKVCFIQWILTKIFTGG